MVYGTNQTITIERLCKTPLWIKMQSAQKGRTLFVVKISWHKQHF
jgi:hypothetical protein